MKKTLILAALSLAAVVSCQKNRVEITDVPTPAEEEAWIADESRPVPIQFSSDVQTKATYGSIDDITELNVGIYALGVTGEYPSQGSNNKTPSWNRENESHASHLLNNEQAMATDGKIVLAGKYYPVGTDLTYSFYAYHPYSESASLKYNTVNGTQAYYYAVEYNLTGASDILYAQSHATNYFRNETTYHGYNAKYIRATKAGGVYENRMPKLAFQHMMTCLRIQLKLTDANANMKINSVKLLNQPRIATLYLAGDRGSTAVMSNNLVAGTTTTDYTLHDATADNNDVIDTDLSNITISTDYTVLGEFFVIPAASYTVEVAYTMYDSAQPGANITGASTITAVIKKTNPFLAGMRYPVGLSIDPTVIELIPSIEAWDDYDLGPIEPGESDITYN